MLNDAAVQTWSPRMLAVLRIMVGLLFLQHGLAKFTGFPVPPPQGFQVLSLFGLAGVIEIVGSTLVTLGLFTRIAAVILSGEMAVAYLLVAQRPARSFFPIANGGEVEVLYCFVFLYLAVAGAGAWSLDASRRRR